MDDTRNMEIQQTEYPKGQLCARNIGGIQETSVEFSPGVTALVGRNATNRTSFLRAVMAALGSENVAMKGDAEEAEVKLTLGNQTYTRYLRRGSNGTVIEGDQFLDDPTLADLFAFLLESNEARRAVATGQHLRELIMRPIDTDEIQVEIDRLVQDRASLKEQLAEIDDLKRDLPELERERTRLQNQIDEKKQEIEAKEQELQRTDETVEETREEKSELEDKLAELRSKRSQLDDVRYDLDTERESLQSLKTERQELEANLNDLSDVPAGEIDEREEEIQRLRQQKQQIEADVNELQSVIGFNEDLLDDAGSSAFAELSETEAKNLTDQLLDDEVTCWTCGSVVNKDQIGATVRQLRELSQTKLDEVNQLASDISELQLEKSEFEQTQRERDRIEQRLSNLGGEIEETEGRIQGLQSRKDELTDEVESLETEIDALESEDYSEVLNLHKEANQLEYELESIETDLDRVDSEIADIEARVDEESDVKVRLEEVGTEIETLRTKIEHIERGAVEEFNEHMDTILDMLGYANLDRIWLERVQREVREGRRTVSKTAFELHVIRTTDSGAAYEDTVDHLSESEREVTGLVFALAGYLAHEVYDKVPFILLDSLEAIDSGRIATLVRYLTDYTEYLIVALLPEDAAALSNEYQRLTEI